MSDEPTKEDIEWAAKCLFEEVECAKTDDPRVPLHVPWSECPDWFKSLLRAMAKHALIHGYRPTSKPMSVRDELADIIYHVIGHKDPYVLAQADAILARFNVTRKGESDG